MNGIRNIILISVVALLSLVNMAFAQFTINGKPIVFNATDSIYMCAISDSLFSHDYIAQIIPDTLFVTKQYYDTISYTIDTIPMPTDSIPTDTIIGVIDMVYVIDTITAIDTVVWHSMCLNDTVMHVNDSIIFEDVRGNKVYHLNVYLSNGDSMCVPITFTNLPIVVLEGDFGYDYVEGLVHVYHPDSVAGMNDMSAKIKWRGGSTNVDGKHKRNYTMKFLNEKGKKQKRQFFGLRTSNYWILNAGQVDLARCRNLVGHELWQDMGHKPYYIDKEPEALTNARGRFVEVILNQEYRGLYSMSENVDQEQMRLMKYDEERAVMHGQLWKTDSWDGTTMGDLEYYNNNKETYRGFETKYPDFDDVKPTDYAVLYQAIAFVVNSSDEEFEQKVEEYFDVPVLIDYYLFIDVLVALDNRAKNMFWACYDKQTDKKLTVGVWDLDCTIGQNYTDKDPHPDVFGPEVDMRSQQMHLIDRMLSIPRYSQMVYDRYWELAERCLNADSLTARYEKYFLQFEKGGAAAREEARWSGDTDVAGLTLDLAAEFEFMSDWISRRFDYLNTVEFCRDNPTTGSKEYMGVVSDEPIYNLLGVAVQKPSGRGIYIQGGRKIFIVP